MRNLSVLSANSPVTKLDLPAFYEGNEKLWFKVVESSFRCHGIVESKKRYDLVLRALKVKQLQQVENIIPAADSDQLEDPYQNIREALIKENTLTENERIETLLHGVHLENNKPTEMLRKLKRLMSDDRPNIPLLTKLFMDKLPGEVQRLLAATGETELDVLTKRAETILATPVKDSKPLKDNRTYVQKSRNDLCFYHDKYGSNATKCHAPCNWQGRPNNIGKEIIFLLAIIVVALIKLEQLNLLAPLTH